MNGKCLNGMLIVLFIALCSGYTFGHSTLNAPNGGEALTAGVIYKIKYSIFIAHPPIDHFELYYSTESSTTGFQAIDLNIIPPDPFAPSGTMYEYDWTVPSISAPEVWAKVIMVAVGDYPDTSDQPFSICGYKLYGDVNGDCRYDFVDFAMSASNWLTDCFLEPLNPGCIAID